MKARTTQPIAKAPDPLITPIPDVIPDSNGTTDRTSEAMAALMLDRQERSNRAKKQIEAILKTERVTIACTGIGFTQDGRSIPQIQIHALE